MDAKPPSRSPGRREGILELLRAAVDPSAAMADLESVAASADEWEAHRGEVLVTEGHLAPQGFVMLTGTASVSVAGLIVARLAPGSAVLPRPGVPMPMSVTADDHAWLLVLAPAELQILHGI